jgi:hypothetical protein
MGSQLQHVIKSSVKPTTLYRFHWSQLKHRSCWIKGWLVLDFCTPTPHALRFADTLFWQWLHRLSWLGCKHSTAEVA